MSLLAQSSFLLERGTLLTQGYNIHDFNPENAATSLLQ